MGDLALLFLPLLDQLFVGLRADLRLVAVQRHVGEALPMHPNHRRLISMMVRRPQNGPADAAHCDAGEVALGRLDFRLFHRVVILDPLPLQKVPHGIFFGQPNGAIAFAPHQGGPLFLVLPHETHLEAVAFCENNFGEIKHRKRPARHPDASHECFERFGSGLHANGDPLR